VKAKTTPRATSQTQEPAAAPCARNFVVPGSLPAALGTPRQPTLFEVAPDSDLADLMGLASGLASFAPALLDLIAADLDAHALEKKARRAGHARWCLERTRGLVDVPADAVATPRLGGGRPRMSPLCALAFLLLRGWLGGVKDGRFRNAVRESISLRIFLENIGEGLPAPSTISENLNAITGTTREAVLRAELALALGERLDDFAMLRVDSTDARSASAYPTDSSTITKLACRACTRLAGTARLGLPPRPAGQLAEWEAALRKLNYQISTLTSSSAKQAERNARDEGAPGATDPVKQGAPEKNESAKARLRRELYERLYARVEEILPGLEEQADTVREQVAAGTAAAAPAQQQRRGQLCAGLARDLADLRHAVGQSRRRVCEGKRPSAAGGMPLGVSDPGASFIEKGSWDRTFGYRPQLGFSSTNLVTALIVPKGNASDQSQLVATIGESIANTGIVPRVVSVDDGYTGEEQLAASLALDVGLVSFSGARGKALLGDEKWESEEYAAARRARNGAESGIFALKKKVGFEQLASSGQERVRGEQLEKVIAYNALKIAALRRRRHEEQNPGKKWARGMPGGGQDAA
jgi:hypothetical protein